VAARTQTPEADRLAALRSLDILDTPAEERFDRITRLAAARGVVLLGGDRDPGSADRPRRPRGPALLREPLVTGPPFIRFYAGQPITSMDGYRVGTLCVIDRRPREFGAGELALLRDLARIAEDEVNHRELSLALAAWRGSE